MRDDRWQNVLQTAFHLEEQLSSGRGDPPEENGRQVCALLDNLLEVFPSSIDPVEDFEGFAVRRLAQALRRALREK
ncbi:MAG TPA: hypothetical protein VLQ93_06630 [Myxococcaceae bacterium]|nr:hypothetical protein [Myxococcaceae bacterium]